MNADEKLILDLIEENREEIITALQTMIRIPSLTGEEGEVQKYQEKVFNDLGLEVDVWEPSIKELFEKYPDIAQYPSSWIPELDLPLRFPDKCTYEQLVSSGYIEKLNYNDRPNVVGTLKGSGNGRSLILNGHIDVVTVEPRDKWTYDPFGGEIADGKLYGRGATDMKGGVVAMTKALEYILKAGVKLRGDVIVQSVVNEEHSGNGTLACIARGYTADAAIVTEGTGFSRLVVQSGGAAYYEIRIKGRETHTGTRWRNGKMYGISANEKLPFLINALLELEREQNKDEVKFSLGIGKIVGGTYATSTALECVISGVVYFTPACSTGVEGINMVKDLIRKAVEDGAKQDPWLRENPPELSFLHYDDACKIEPSADIVQTVLQAGKDCFGQEMEVSSMSANDSRHLVNTAGIPTLVYGPGTPGVAHSVDEYVEIDDLINSTKVLALAIYRWCK